ncbi:hypothetical protein OCAR_6191 [Afipia carboxidovorans OM5]|nr:hypothetical protein OCAR_6191 [Afipia carboxidovorans OM5]
MLPRTPQNVIEIESGIIQPLRNETGRERNAPAARERIL